MSHLITAMGEAHLTCAGEINGILLRGLDFVVRITLDYGAFLEYGGKGGIRMVKKSH